MNNMKSEIWRVSSERVGSIESFRSERDMESFLMNNPSLIVEWDSETLESLPVKQQNFIRDVDNSRGRIDIIGLTKIDEKIVLRVFELKNGPITAESVKQIKGYLDSWKNEKRLKNGIRTWISELNLPGITEKTIDTIIESPVGVLIGTTFSAEAIVEAQNNKISGVRLARFRGASKLDYYVIVENQIGDIIRRRNWSWQDLIDANLIRVDDQFTFSYAGQILKIRPEPDKLDWNIINVIFDQASRDFLLKMEKKILENAPDFAKKPVEKGLDALHRGGSLALTNATALAFFALGMKLKSFWTPTGFWVHEKSGKILSDLKLELFD